MKHHFRQHISRLNWDIPIVYHCMFFLLGTQNYTIVDCIPLAMKQQLGPAEFERFFSHSSSCEKGACSFQLGPGGSRLKKILKR
jgi:hypothetical protein